MVRVRIRAERSNVNVARRSIQRDRLDKGFVRLETQHADTTRGGVLFERPEQPPANAETANAGGDPHALELGGLGAVELERAASDSVPVEGCEHEETGGRTQFGLRRGDTPLRIEACRKPGVELVDIGTEAVLRLWIAGIGDRDLDHPSCHETLDLGHRCDKPGALVRAQCCQQRGSQSLAPLLENGSLGASARGQPRGPDAPVRGIRAYGDHARGFERAQEPAHVSGVEPELCPERSHVAIPVTDLPEDARLAEGAIPGQEAIVERPDPLGDDAVEPAHLIDLGLIHPVTLVREHQENQQSHAALVRLSWHRRSTGSTAPSRTRWAGTVVAAAVLASIAVVLGTRSAMAPPAGPTGAAGVPAGALRAHVVSALDALASDVLTIHRTSSISDGGALNEDVWLSPSLPSTGQQVRRRSLILDASGAPVLDFEVTFTMPADPPVISGANVGIDATGGAARAFRATGSTIDVDYPSRSWSGQSDRSVVIAMPDDLAAVQGEIQSGGWTAGGVANLHGRRAIELTWHGGTATEVTHRLWIDPDTYLPFEEIYSGGMLGTVESDYTLLPSSSANLAALSPSPPAGFRNASAGA